MSGTQQKVYIECVSLNGTFLASDRWSFRPAIMSLLTVASLQLVCQLPGRVSFLFISLSLLAYLAVLIFFLIVAVYCLIKKCPRRAASVFLILLLPVLLWLPINKTVELIHVGLTAGFGIGQLAVSKSNDSDFVVYDWSVGLAGSNTFLIHDASDEIALPMDKHKHPLSSENGFGEECAGRVERLVSHYYVCNF